MNGACTLRAAGLAAALTMTAAAAAPVAAQVEEEIGPAVGSPAPDFTLAAVADGAEHTLAEHRGERPVVMVFFRGTW